VLTGVKYEHQIAGQRIGKPGRRPFEFIAPPAGKTQVVKRGLTSLGLGDDVIDNHGLARIGCGCLTISTAVVVYFNQLTAQGGRQICAH
jgi:hypothetical protein